MIKEYISLIHDTIKYLKASEIAYFHANKEELDLFHLPQQQNKTTIKLLRTKNITTTVKPKKTSLTKEITSATETTGDTTKSHLSTPAVTVVTKKISQADAALYSDTELLPIKESLSPSHEKPLHTKEQDDTNLQHIRMIMEKLAPNILEEDIPDDEEAKLISQKWKYASKASEITIICATQNTQQQIVLKNLAKALSISLLTATFIDPNTIEKDDIWKEFLSADILKFIIIDDNTINNLPNLKKYYRQIPTTGENFLKHTPVISIPHPSYIIQNPLSKASLWKNLITLITNDVK
jgi:hypothetical protein